MIQELEDRNVDIPTHLVSTSLNSSASSKTSSASGSNDAGSNSWEEAGKTRSQLDGFVPGLDCLNTSLTAQTRLSENNLDDQTDARAQAARKDELTMTVLPSHNYLPPLNPTRTTYLLQFCRILLWFAWHSGKTEQNRSPLIDEAG